ncbi:hypothetical protein Y032_0430g1305 [Ancylostoma ceylanicum]|uniref:7TM GPCR serpentine receptor class x (Srx) domain-containing protein n=1 Tax=Ancylostoma ceylanicum TaxID=53326 RepID=A0A016X0E0_9BILA|nr:hypothetical protein Y032_0430g1305 [Ancylostoma ceylanicum]
MEWLIRHGGNGEDIPGYDCKLSDRQPGGKNYIIGSVFIIYGLFVEFIYMLDLMVMTKKKHRRLSCYKIMIVLGVYDMAAISLNSILTGYFWITGANYCTNPTLMFVAGTVALGLWCGACMNCFVLVINRTLDMWNKSIMQALFMDGKTYLILLIPLAYSLYFCFFTSPLLFNSDATAWFFSTFAPGHNHELARDGLTGAMLG